MFVDTVVNAALYVIPLLLGVVCHEVAHGWVAEKRGDPTARLMGRLTLNPFAHIDLMGTVFLPVTLLVIGSPFLFGWAKPVPVNFNNLRGGRGDMALVGIAGPLTNFVLATLSALVCHLVLAGVRNGFIQQQGWPILVLEPVFQMARISVTFNLVLMVVNMLPIPPLDGGRVLMGLLPSWLAVQLGGLEKFGTLILLVLIMTKAWGYVVQPVVNMFSRFLLG
ncbi:MAG: site-2 protease family protein [Syntrophobacteraceae bacterium]